MDRIQKENASVLAFLNREKYMMDSKRFLKTAAILSFGVAAFQAAISAVPDWSRYFGAGEALVSKLWLLYLLGFFVTMLFAVSGLYALSGGGYIRRLPLIRTGLITISAVYILRGINLVPELLVNAGAIHSTDTIPLRNIIVSTVSLLIGLLYLVGIIGYWSQLPKKSSP